MKVVFFYCTTKDREKELLMKSLKKTMKITVGLMVTHCVFPGPLQYIAYASDFEEGIQGINTIGYAIWRVIKAIAMFALAAFTVRDILKEMNESSIKDMSTIVLKYTAAWAVVVFILKIFAWIDKLAK